MASKIRKNDKVVILAGKDKGKEGRVLSINHKNSKVIIEGLNMIKKHSKSNQANPQGGIIDRESPIHISNIAYLHNGKPTRIGFKVEISEVDGKQKRTKRRIAKSTGDIID